MKSNTSSLIAALALSGVLVRSRDQTALVLDSEKNDDGIVHRIVIKNDMDDPVFQGAANQVLELENDRIVKEMTDTFAIGQQENKRRKKQAKVLTSDKPPENDGMPEVLTRQLARKAERKAKAKAESDAKLIERRMKAEELKRRVAASKNGTIKLNEYQG